MSVCEIDTAETYEKGRPKRGGLSDPRMGTMDRAMACETDGMNSTDTPGYFGHLELAKPVFHHGFIKNVVSVLRCVGFSSSKLMIDKVRAGQRHALVDLHQPPNVFQTGSHRFFVAKRVDR